MPPLPGLLLFWQICLLAGVAGVLATREILPGLLLFVLTWWLDLPRTSVRNKAYQHTLLLAVTFCLAFGYACWRTPAAPPVPLWLTAATTPAPDSNDDERMPGPVRIRAQVQSCTPLHESRLRLILAHASPVKNNSATQLPASDAESSAYAGNIMWTWRTPDAAPPAPLPGQWVEATVRLAPVHGMANPGTWDTEQYWQDRGVWFRAWSGSSTRLEVIDPAAGAFSRIRQSLYERFLANLPQNDALPASTVAPTPAAAVLPALVFGDRSFLTPKQTDYFAQATLSHSLALSGLHLGYAAALGFALACGVGRCFPGLWLRIPRPLAVLLLALPLAGIYLWLGQAPVSLVRAACMLVFWATLMLLKRPKVMLDGLCFAVAFLLLLDPLSLFDISLQLSALSVATIALCFPTVSRMGQRLFPFSPKRAASASSGPPSLWMREIVITILRGTLTLAGVSFCIQVMLSPLTIRAFGTAGLWFPLNLIWLPVLGSLVMPLAFAGLLLSSLGLDSLAQLALHGATLPCEALLWLLARMDTASLLIAPVVLRPHWMSGAGFWLLCLFLPQLFLAPPAGGQRQKIRAVIALGLFLLLLPPGMAWYASQQPGVRLRVLDVGQGQAVLVEWSGLAQMDLAQPGTSWLPFAPRHSGRVLIDGGGFSSGSFDTGEAVVAPVLTDNALPRVDMIINSHPDTDHLAGLLYLLRHFQTRAYATNGDTATPALAAQEKSVLEQTQRLPAVLTAGDVLALAPDLNLEVLWPPRGMVGNQVKGPRKGESGNNASLILRLVWQGKPLALVCGDAELPALRALTESTAGAEHLTAQALVLPHHGSGKSLLPAFYDAVQPAVALASCGFSNQWGFPAASVRAALQERGIPLYTTARDGQLSLIWETQKNLPRIVTTRELDNE